QRTRASARAPRRVELDGQVATSLVPRSMPTAQNRTGIMSGVPNKLATDALRYLAAVALCAVSVGVAILFRGVGGMPDGLVFAASIAIAGRFLGLGPSLFASALSVILIDLLITPPIGSIDLTQPEDITYSLTFVVLSLVISGTTHS